MTGGKLTMSVQNNWDAAYDNSGHVDGSEALPALWAAEAAAYRDAASAAGRRVDLDVPYGEHTRERMDIVFPDSTPKGLVVFVHGGYWMRMDKSYWTQFAEGARAKGWAVCLPSYTLAPEARISQITGQIGRAISTAAALIPGPMYLSGHSAGGHLVSRMVCADSPLSEDLHTRLKHTLSISGLHDLRPLLNTQMNATLCLDMPEAQAESAALLTPMKTPSLTAWVGGGERPEFIRQAELLSMIWQGFDGEVSCVIDGSHDHFTVIGGLKDPQSAITKALLRQT